jgi:hypothetical protein
MHIEIKMKNQFLDIASASPTAILIASRVSLFEPPIANVVCIFG